MSFLPHISNSLNGYIFLAVNRIAYLYWFPENCSGNIECNSDLCSATESWGMVIWYYVLFLFPSFWLVLFGYWFGLWWKLSCLMPPLVQHGYIFVLFLVFGILSFYLLGQVVYAIMHRQEVFQPFRNHPHFNELLENIFNVCVFYLFLLQNDVFSGILFSSCITVNFYRS